MIINVNGQPQQEFIATGDALLYTLQVDEFARAVAAGQKQVKFPAMSWNDTYGNMKALDMWRRSVGMTFDTEKPEGMPLTASGKKPAKSPRAPMKYSRIPGLNKDISRIVMGSMIFSPDDHPFTFSMLDYFFEVGGNTIDLAHVYGGGNSEKAVGQWVRTRGNREEVVILDKGAHPPNCTPDKARAQITESLQRLGLDYIDIYCLHRDNLDVPVKEWVDALNDEVKAGRIRIFGGSNWTTARLEEANTYAVANNKMKFACSSPNFSLALWNKPTWDGCLTASDKVSRDWYAKNQMPLFSWSSQAMGFFSGRVKKEDIHHPDGWARLAVETWWNESNQKKLERARELGAKKGVDGVQIAMAYVLSQPFLTFALIGPRTIEETRTSMLGLDLKLSADEVKWLNLES
jgi:aryl-alcohol dehydrogenase-like predicted oxidoreductase